MLIGIDVGGTFTDVVALDGNRVSIWKGPSTPEDPAIGFLRGLDAVTEGSDYLVSDIRHGTTAATNAIITRTGATTALVTTQGFRDLLEIRRLRFPRLYDLTWTKPDPLVPRHRRLEAQERVDGSGRVTLDVDTDPIVRRLETIVENDGVTAVAISLINGHLNDHNERELLKAIAAAYPQLVCSLGSWVSREPGEVERTSTAAVNAYVGPVLSAYLERVVKGLAKRGIGAPIMVMRSDGGLVPLKQSLKLPALVVESGPAAGVTAAAALGNAIDKRDLLTVDVGGTTAKTCLITDGRPSVVSEYTVGGEASAASRFSGGDGYIIRGPAFDIAEIGAGGGSIVKVTPGGRVTVGPESAGSVPGPACYGRGGDMPTVTDAHVVIGNLGHGQVLGGSIRLNSHLSIQVFTRPARRIGCSVHEAAYGAIQVANALMVRLLRNVTVARGRDPRSLSLLAYGGAGGLHAAELAKALHIATVIVPPNAGLFSAQGLLVGRPSAEHVVSVRRRLDVIEEDHLRRFMYAAKAELESGDFGILPSDRNWEFSADMRNVGQAQVITVEVDEAMTVRELEKRYQIRYREQHRMDPGSAPVEVVSVRARLSSSVEHRGLLSTWTNQSVYEKGNESFRLVYWGKTYGSIRTAVIPWQGAPEGRVDGPLIVEAPDTTVVVPPYAAWNVDGRGYGIMTPKSFATG